MRTRNGSVPVLTTMSSPVIGSFFSFSATARIRRIWGTMPKSRSSEKGGARRTAIFRPSSQNSTARMALPVTIVSIFSMPLTMSPPGGTMRRRVSSVSKSFLISVTDFWGMDGSTEAISAAGSGVKISGTCRVDSTTASAPVFASVTLMRDVYSAGRSSRSMTMGSLSPSKSPGKSKR